MKRNKKKVAKVYDGWCFVWDKNKFRNQKIFCPTTFSFTRKGAWDKLLPPFAVPGSALRSSLKQSRRRKGGRVVRVRIVEVR